MEQREEHDMGAVAMPGFIDILSTVIIMFVFFVTVIAVILYVHTVKFKAEVESENQLINSELLSYLEKIEAEKMTEQDIDDLIALAKQRDSLEERLKVMKDEAREIQSRFAESKSKTQETEERISERSIIIFFEKNAITTEEGLKQTIADFLERFQSDEDPIRIFLSAPANNPASPTSASAKEVGLARMLNTRNHLIELGLGAENIDLTYARNDDLVAGNYNWVKLVVE